MTTDVSSSPRSRRDSGTRRRVLVEDAIDLGAEPGWIDPRGSGERAHDDVRRDEAATPERDQLTHGRPVAGDDEGLALVECSHDLAAVVPELALGDLPCHTAIVARVRHVLHNRQHDNASSNLPAYPTDNTMTRRETR